jgi:hypothetical protein
VEEQGLEDDCDEDREDGNDQDAPPTGSSTKESAGDTERSARKGMRPQLGEELEQEIPWMKRFLLIQRQNKKRRP